MIRTAIIRTTRERRALLERVSRAASVALALTVTLLAPCSAAAATGAAPTQEQRAPDEVDPDAVLEVAPGAGRFEEALVRQGAQLSHTFDFGSGGKAPLIVRRVIPNCGCLYTGLSVKEPGAEGFAPYSLGEPIPPGSDVRLRVDVDTTLKQDRAELSVRLATNASREPSVFNYIINVVPTFEVTPAAVLFGDVRRDASHVREVMIRSTSGEKVRFTLDEATRRPLPEGLTYDFGPVEPDGEGRSDRWRLRVRLAEGMKEGPGGYRFLYVSDVSMPETPTVIRRREAAKARGRAVRPTDERFCVNLLANYRILGDVEVTPGVVSFGQIRKGQTLTRKVRLVATRPGIDLSKATATIRGTLGLEVPIPESLSVELSPVPGEDAMEATVTLSDVPADFRGTIRCELHFESGYEGRPSLSVPITGVVL